jgi:hypothetical protein
MLKHFLLLGIEQLTVQPVKEISGHVKLPGSKSLSNRILLLAALSEGTTLVKNLLVRIQSIISMECFLLEFCSDQWYDLPTGF